MKTITVYSIQYTNNQDNMAVDGNVHNEASAKQSVMNQSRRKRQVKLNSNNIFEIVIGLI